MLELQILGYNVALPCVVMVFGIIAARSMGPRRENLARVVVVAAGVLSIVLAFGFRVGFTLWPEDAWARLPQVAALAGLGSLVAILLNRYWLGGIVIAVTSLIGAYITIPQGEAWEFLEPSVPTWMTALTLSPLLAWLGARRSLSREACYLGFGIVCCLAASAFLTQEFLKVTEPILAFASIIGCASLAAWSMRTPALLQAVIPIGVAGTAASIASANFNSYADAPVSLYYFAIACPPLLAILTLLTAGKAPPETPPDAEAGSARAEPQTASSLRHSAAVVFIALALSTTLVVWTGNSLGP